MDQTNTETSAPPIKADNKMMQEHNQAFAYCEDLIKWYEETKRSQRRAYWASQIITIVLSGITPILILVDSIPAVLQAIPPAIVTITIGLSGVFQWKENYLRFAHAAETLKSEKIRFKTRSSKDYNRKWGDAIVLDRFVTRVDIIAMGEVGEWRTLMQEVTDPNADE